MDAEMGVESPFFIDGLPGKTANGQEVYIVPTPMEGLADAGKDDE
jgi:hypothetical protein